jgi:hypothetical protein
VFIVKKSFVKNLFGRADLLVSQLAAQQRRPTFHV